MLGRLTVNIDEEGIILKTPTITPVASCQKIDTSPEGSTFNLFMILLYIIKKSRSP